MTFALLVIAGALLSLDRTQAFQAMVSRPIVAATLLGWWAGAPAEGAAIGAAFEFLYAGRLPVGSNIPPTDTLAAIGAAGLLVFEPGLAGWGNAGLAAALALPLAEVGRALDIGIRRVNGRIAARVEALVSGGDLSYVEPAMWLSLGVAASAYAVTLAVFFATAGYVVRAAAPLPLWLDQGFALFLAGLPLVGLAESTATLDLRRYAPWAAAGLAAGIAVLLVI